MSGSGRWSILLGRGANFKKPLNLKPRLHSKGVEKFTRLKDSHSCKLTSQK